MASRRRADGSLPPLTLYRRWGARLAIMLRPEHAAVVRRAVKTFARYYGIRLSDVGGSWVTTAMRSAAPLSLTWQKKLYYTTQLPPGQITKKRPQGPPLTELIPALLQFWEDPVAHPLPQNAATVYLNAVFEAAAILNAYVAPFPGSSAFGNSWSSFVFS